MSDNLLQTSEASTVVLRDLFVTPLRNEADDETTPLSDPKASQRDGSAPLVLTSFPDTGLLYPHIIVERLNASSRSLDWQGDVYEHDYQIRITVHAKSSTTSNKMIDSVIHWAERERQWLHSNGFMEAEVGSATPANWESDPSVTSVQVVIDGLVNTSHKA